MTIPKLLCTLITAKRAAWLGIFERSLALAAPLKKERELADIFIKLSQLLRMQRIRTLLRSSKSPVEILEVLAKVLDWREEPADVDENRVSTY